MNAELLYEALNDQHSLEQLNEQELERLVCTHPYFSIGQLLLAKKLRQENDQESYQQQRSRVQTFYRNPWWLYYQLELSDAAHSNSTSNGKHSPTHGQGPILVGTDRWPDVNEMHSPSEEPTTGDGVQEAAAPFESIAHEVSAPVSHEPERPFEPMGAHEAREITGSAVPEATESAIHEIEETHIYQTMEPVVQETAESVGHEIEMPSVTQEPEEPVAHEIEEPVVTHETAAPDTHEAEGERKLPHLLSMVEEDAPPEYPLYPTNPPKEHTQEIPEQHHAAPQPFEIPPMPVMVASFMPEGHFTPAAAVEQPVSPSEQPPLPGEEPAHAPSEAPETAPAEWPSVPGVEVPASPEQEPHEVPEGSPAFPKEVPPDGPREIPAEEPVETPGGWPSEIPVPAPGPELPSLPVERPIAAEHPAAAFSVHALNTGATFEPFYTVDYFASQGIKLSLEENATDKLSQHLKSFTEWLRTMKRINTLEPTREELDTASEAEIQHLASSANRQKEAVVTESMAQVWVHQGKIHKAIEVYNKLSLQHPEKRAYFAAKIEQLNRQ